MKLLTAADILTDMEWGHLSFIRAPVGGGAI